MQHTNAIFNKAKSKVPRDIQGIKSNKDMANSKNMVATTGAKASPKKGGRNQGSGWVIVSAGMSLTLKMLN